MWISLLLDHKTGLISSTLGAEINWNPRLWDNDSRTRGHTVDEEDERLQDGTSLLLILVVRMTENDSVTVMYMNGV